MQTQLAHQGRRLLATATHLTTPLPGIDYSSVTAGTPSPQAVQTATLENGVRVSSVASGGDSAVSAVGCMVPLGPRFEDASNAGVSYLLQHLFLKSTENRTGLRIFRELEAAGATVQASADREYLLLWGECLAPAVPLVMDILGDSLTCPALVDDELIAEAPRIAEQIDLYRQNPKNVLLEAVHAQAFGGKALGRALIASTSRLEQLTSAHLHSALSTLATEDVIAVGVGVNHDSFAALAKDSFAGLQGPGTRAGVQDKTTYVGGEARIEMDAPFTHVAIAFEGASNSSPDLFTSSVASMLLGGGESFSAGGPGKGMYSRLYQNLLTRNAWMDSANHLSPSYSDGAIFGVSGSGPAEAGAQLTEALLGELVALKGPIDNAELARAKNRLKAALAAPLDSRPGRLENIALHTSAYGKVAPLAEQLAKVDAVSAADINAFATKALKTNPTVVSVGDTSTVPTAAAVKSSIA